MVRRIARASQVAVLALVVLVGIRAMAGAVKGSDTLPPLVQVERVLDGDTIDLPGDGASERVRLLGVNAPEKRECMGPEAGEALRALVAEGVRVERAGVGSHGRTLAHLFTADGHHVQLALVSGGLALAVSYGRKDPYTPGLEAAQGRAEAAGLGMFAPDACGAVVDGASELRITEVNANPDGDDLAPGAGESVLIEGRPGFELTGWALKDTSATHRYRFADGVRLDGAGQLRVYTSCGEPTPAAVFWCKKGSAVWNNGGDTAFLLDPAGNIAASAEYTGK
jgi:endonuclease YncB( thermonuclease family)